MSVKQEIKNSSWWARRPYSSMAKNLYYQQEIDNRPKDPNDEIKPEDLEEALSEMD